MNPRNLEVTGAWFQVGGNLIAAIGTTRGVKGEEHVEEALVIVGGSLQALGYILQLVALGEKQEVQVEKKVTHEERQIKNRYASLERTGLELLVLGNVSNVIGTFFNVQRKIEENEYLIITGNSLQSLGAFVGVQVALHEVVIPWMIVRGNSLQTLGAGMQAYEGIKNISKKEKINRQQVSDIEQENKPEKEDTRIISLIGIWIQAIGTAITAIGITQMIEN